MNIRFSVCAAQGTVMTAAMIALFVVMALTVLTLFALIFLSYEKNQAPKEEEKPLPPEEPEVIYMSRQTPVYWIEPGPEPEPIEKLVPVPVVVPFAEEESFESGAVRYDRSFTAKLIQSDDATKHRYTQLKNFLLSFSKVKDKTSWKHESFRCGREVVATLLFRGKTLCVVFPLSAEELKESKYRVESFGEETGRCLYRIKSDLRLRYAKELYESILLNLGSFRIERESVDYFLPYEGVVELIDKGLVKRKITTRATEEFLKSQKENTELALIS